MKKFKNYIFIYLQKKINSNWIPPRLFVINSDDTGMELLNKEQLANYFRIKDNDKNCQKISDDKVNGLANAQCLSFLTKLIPWPQRKPTFINVHIPKNIDILPQTLKKLEEPDKKDFLLRNLLIFPEFDQENREIFKKDLEKYDVWKKNENKEISEFGIIEKSEEEKDKEFSIQMKILESRNKQFHEENYNERKTRLMDLWLSMEMRSGKSVQKSQTNIPKKKVQKKNTKTSVAKPISESLDLSRDSQKSTKTYF